MTMSPDEKQSTTALVTILRKVLRELPGGPGITAHDELLALGVSSLQLMQIVVEIEKGLGVEFPDAALALENFESVASLAAVVDSLKSPAHSPKSS